MTDRLTVRAVAIGLVLVVMGTVAALVIILTAVDLTAEQRGQVLGVLGSIGTGALGAAAALLAHTASSDPAPPDVPPAP